MTGSTQNTNRFFEAENMQRLLHERQAIEKEVAARPGIALLAALGLGIVLGIGIKRL